MNRMGAREVFGLGRMVKIFRKLLGEGAQSNSGVAQGEDPRSDSAATLPVEGESDLEGQYGPNCSAMDESSGSEIDVPGDSHVAEDRAPGT